jgi:hypothetical protein
MALPPVKQHLHSTCLTPSRIWPIHIATASRFSYSSKIKLLIPKVRVFVQAGSNIQFH